MLAIRSTNPQKCTPNLLPARLEHNGPINVASRYWEPELDEHNKNHAYFRGRHLHGTSLPLPFNYTGAVLHITDKDLPQAQQQQQDGAMEEDDDEEEEAKVEVKLANTVGEFEEVVIWEHGGEVDRSQSAFVRGLTEWVGFAEAMHVDGDEEEAEKEEKKAA